MYWRPYDMKIIITVALSALAVTSSAAAIPDPNSNSGYDASAITDAARPTQSMSPDDRAFSRVLANPSIEIPYLSQGVGVDDRAVSRAAEGAAQATQGNPLTQLRRADARQAREDALKAAAEADGVNLNPLTVVVHHHGFAWGNASEGAALGFGFAALLAGLALLIVRSRRVVAAT